MENRLRELRESKNLTMRELSNKLGVDYSTIGHIERGRKNFSIESLLNAADFFDVSTDYLLCRDLRAKEAKNAE